MSIVVANVLMSNRQADRLVEIVREWDPDLVLTLEPDDWWDQPLRVLEADYPHTVKAPLDNRYGTLLHSRLELIEPDVKHLISDESPSMHMRVAFGSDHFPVHAKLVLEAGAEARQDEMEADADDIEQAEEKIAAVAQQESM